MLELDTTVHTDTLVCFYVFVCNVQLRQIYYHARLCIIKNHFLLFNFFFCILLGFCILSFLSLSFVTFLLYIIFFLQFISLFYFIRARSLGVDLFFLFSFFSGVLNLFYCYSMACDKVNGAKIFHFKISFLWIIVWIRDVSWRHNKSIFIRLRQIAYVELKERKNRRRIKSE